MGSKEYFDNIARDWDDMRRGFFSESLRNRAIAAAGVRAGTVAADVGAGTGFVTEGLLSAGVRVIAVDESAEMLAEMKRRLGEPAGIEYRVGESARLPVHDGEVDSAFANMYLHHVEDPAAAIREMARILRPNGMLVVTDLDEHAYEFLSEEQHDRWLGFKREDIRRWFLAAGLADVAVDCADENCCASSSCGCEASVGIFIASGRK